MDTEKGIGRIALWVCIIAVLMDGGTGVLLVTAPAFTIRLMGMNPDLEPLAYMQFIGAFVFAVGSLYGFALKNLMCGRVSEWRALWFATAWARLCVGSTVAGLILTDRLDPSWISVPVVDLGLAVFQFWLLAKSRGSDA
ncbi:hypothetical protein [Pelagicoccus albus]|uniref:DUF4345 domain-containing protein n=1 Tax=Pelagicoccus albus TaxID=415222 RepID=A0A7X1B7K6_9BACT|nr:hypothetical protein [Pelagicoccus albus]MBC2607122.1 hypothetical protein [Pelagicoccus albus]